tara:strand:+ start:5439 stop:5705 length:267 start_codon:yes stop_codon:yes gene_type:complete
MSQQEDYGTGLLNRVVEVEGALKEYLVDYVGNKIKPENDEVTVHMVIQVLASEFPELVVSIIEENYLKGYQQGLDDAVDMQGTIDHNV